MTKSIRHAAAVLLAVCLAAPALAQETPPQLDGVKVVTAEQAREMASKGAALVDTRVANEFVEKSAQGAINVPYKEKSAKDITFDRAVDNFDLAKLPTDKNAPLVMFCNSGTCWKSYKASVLARDAGYKQVH